MPAPSPPYPLIIIIIIIENLEELLLLRMKALHFLKVANKNIKSAPWINSLPANDLADFSLSLMGNVSVVSDEKRRHFICAAGRSYPLHTLREPEYTRQS